MNLPVPILTVLSRSWRPISRSRVLARRIFRVDFPELGRADQYFDVTTPLLVNAAARRLKRESRFLDMGTGAFATIGLGVWKKVGCRVVSSDIHPRILEQARANIALNRAPIEVVESRFFASLEGAFDVVTFNPPYVPAHLAQTPTYARPFDFQSNGGPDGSLIIEQFLDAFAVDGGGAIGLIGMNELFVSGPRVLELIKARPSLRLDEIDRVPASPFYVIAVRRGQAPLPLSR